MSGIVWCASCCCVSAACGVHAMRCHVLRVLAHQMINDQLRSRHTKREGAPHKMIVGREGGELLLLIDRARVSRLRGARGGLQNGEARV